MRQKLLELNGMGALCGCRAGIFTDGQYIFCDSLNEVYECDLAQAGWGGDCVLPSLLFSYKY